MLRVLFGSYGAPLVAGALRRDIRVSRSPLVLVLEARSSPNSSDSQRILGATNICTATTLARKTGLLYARYVVPHAATWGLGLLSMTLTYGPLANHLEPVYTCVDRWPFKSLGRVFRPDRVPSARYSLFATFRRSPTRVLCYECAAPVHLSRRRGWWRWTGRFFDHLW